jgi:hypothetical protein
LDRCGGFDSISICLLSLEYLIFVWSWRSARHSNLGKEATRTSDGFVCGGGRTRRPNKNYQTKSLYIFYFFSLYFLFIIISCINLIIISCINLFYNVDNLFFFPRMSKFFIFYFFALERCGHIGWFG